MAAHRIVPNLISASPRDDSVLYTGVLGLEPVMDQGWIVTYADPTDQRVQISLLTHDATAPVVPAASIQVDDVDGAHSAAIAAGLEIVHPLTDEPWGVRRFFVRDPSGNVINVVSHRAG